MDQNIQKPSIRFKGFTDTWEQYKFNQIMDTVTDFVAAGSFADMAENVVYESLPDYAQLVRTTDLKSNFSNNNFVYVNKKAFDFLWRVHLDTESIIMPNIGNCGEIYYVNQEILPYKHNVLGPNAILVRSENQNNKFLSVSFLSDDFQRKLKLIVSPNGQTKFNKTELKTLDVIIPSVKEQIKVGTLFDSLDSLITLHQRKYDKLVNTKKALLDKMFPKAGEVTPKLRFRGFTDAWEQYKLKQVTVYKNGKGHEHLQSDIGDYELINLNSISIDGGLKPSGRFVSYSDDTLSKDDLVMVLSDVAHGDLLGRVALIPENNKYVLNQRVALLRPNGVLNPNYLYYIINNHQNYFKLQGAGSSQLNISKDSVENFSFLAPNSHEQSDLTLFFDKIDNLITLHQRKYEKLKNIKKALLQKMFV